MTLIADIEHHRPDLVRRARRSLQPADAEDLASDTILKALRYHDRYQPDRSLLAWLLTIQTRIYIDHRRRQHPTLSYSDLTPAADDVERQVLARIEIEDALAERRRLILDRVREPYLSTALAILCEGCTYQDVSARLGIPTGTVRSRLFRAREAMGCNAVSHGVT